MARAVMRRRSLADHTVRKSGRLSRRVVLLSFDPTALQISNLNHMLGARMPLELPAIGLLVDADLLGQYAWFGRGSCVYWSGHISGGGIYGSIDGCAN
jgi:hypothetical protein